jgi:hypothetical protein
MTENPKKKIKTRKDASKTTTLIESVNKDLVAIYDRTLSKLEETMKNAKINPGQGLLGMLMVADLLHGGAYACPTSDRPFLVGKTSQYYVKTILPTVDQFPITAGLSFLDIVGSLLGILQQANEGQVGAAITSEIYSNANCPHKFPKLLSDEIYSRIVVAGIYLIHQDIAGKGYANLKTFVEASAIPLKTAAEATEKTTEAITRMLSALPAETGETGD